MTNVFELFAKLSLDKEGFEKGLQAAAKGAVVAIGAAATAIGTLSKMAVDNYAQYEQLVGGVETLFGAQGMTIEKYAESVGKTVEECEEAYNNLIAAQESVMQSAKDAYKNAGLSANQYMETVTSFSAALIAGLGGDTVKAAEIADKAIVDMADNANKMGSSMESIQSAYQGFAKQNYTMLDNLKLGYGGTASEMIRLINDSGILEQKISSLDGITFDQIVEAIHAVQENLGIAGATAEEAEKTIEGSANAMKAAWQNLLTGFADADQDVGELVDKLLTTGETYMNNIAPRFEQALLGISQGITNALPKVLEKIPELIQKLIPMVLSTGTKLITTFIGVLVKDIPDGIRSLAPLVMGSIAEVLTSLGETLYEALPELIETIFSIGTELLETVGSGLAENIPILLENILPAILHITEVLRENFGAFVDAGIDLIMNLVDGIIAGIPQLVAYVPEIVTNIARLINDNAPKILEAGINILMKLIQGLIDSIPVLVDNLPQIINAIFNVIQAVNWMNLGKEIINGLGNGIKSMWNFAKESMGKIKEAVLEGGNAIPQAVISIGENIVKGVWNGIVNMTSWFKEKVSGFFTSIVDNVKSTLGIQSPSKVFAEIGGYMAQGLGVGWEEEYANVQRTINDGLRFDASNIDVEPLQGINDDEYLGGNIVQNIYINQQIETADELARKLRTEAKYGLMRGVSIG